MRTKKSVRVFILPILIIIVLLVLIAGVSYRGNLRGLFSQPSQKDETSQTVNGEEVPRTSVIASNLEVPWSLAFLPDGAILVTEREGRVRLVTSGGNLQQEPVVTVASVKQIGEGGLHGIALHPDFEKNKFIYLYYTYGESGGETLNRVVRFEYEGNRLNDEEIIVDQIPGASNHDGGRIKFGPDGFLYITTGDAQNPSLAQDKNSLAGKILRVTDSGGPASGNPFGNRVYSYGHRNPQGIAWDESGNLWETEHGSSTVDELNRIEISKNYGWPTVQGDQTQEGLVPPVVHSGSDTWAPAGATYLSGSVYFGGLRGQALYQAVLSGNTATLKTHFKGEFGRIRDVVVGPDNMLYITTSNRDGRGNSASGDDKIIRVSPAKL